MAIVSQARNDYVIPSMYPLTPINMYLERVKTISNSLRTMNAGLAYVPFDFGGLLGQQQSLTVNSVIKVIDFQVNNN